MHDANAHFSESERAVRQVRPLVTTTTPDTNLSDQENKRQFAAAARLIGGAAAEKGKEWGARLLRPGTEGEARCSGPHLRRHSGTNRLFFLPLSNPLTSLTSEANWRLMPLPPQDHGHVSATALDDFFDDIGPFPA